eukprot:gene47000-63666_t
MKILVTGSNGQLGKCLQDLAPSYPAIEFVFLDREKLPLDQFEKVEEVVKSLQPDAVINAAAYTAVGGFDARGGRKGRRLADRAT